MKALFIGGTGTISAAISALCVKRGWELWLLNRGSHTDRVPEGAHVLHADVNDEAAVREAIGDRHFDVAADFIAFTPDQVRRDVRLFKGRTAQYFFISSASAYQKPPVSPHITESTPLCNPYWEYSRNKIACEEELMKEYRECGFPITLIRPSHTWCERSIPVACHGAKGGYSVVNRIRQGKKVIIPGDGTSLWTLTFSTDFAEAFVGLMGNVHAIGNAYQITSDESLTWNQVYETIAQALGVPLHAVHIASETLAGACKSFEGELIGDKSNTVLFDNSKVKQAVPGFKAQVRFDQGVRIALDYIDHHPECQVPDPEFDAWTDQIIERYEQMQRELPILNKG